MASNFKSIRHHNSDSLRLNLTGDFDGSSALDVREGQTGPRKKKEIFDNDKIEDCFSALVSILHGSDAIEALAALLERSDESSEEAPPLNLFSKSGRQPVMRRDEFQPQCA
jgi:hypothetical protein